MDDEMEITTKDGTYTIRVFSTMYVDWGLEIVEVETGETKFYNPCCLSNETYGFTTEDEDGKELSEGIPWTDEEWKETLTNEANEFVEAFIGES